MKQEVKGDIFIIPNESGRKNEFEPTYWEGLMKSRLSRLAGIELKDEDEMVQVWIISSKCDNWSDTFGGFQEVIENNEWEDHEEGKRALITGYFPNYIPKRLIEGKKEGDNIELTCPEYGVKITLTCRQLKYRYGRFGKFEEVLKQVCA